ncbi:MAG: nuclear transport factor 2 family protein [Pseudooceanicola sp.]|nr:nuclear transport factor 2 family protein [Pseudooceanicola sp.]
MTDPFANGDALRVQALITDYVWKLDMADVDGVVALFTEDGVFEDTAGNEHHGHAGIRAYFAGLVARPEFRGRQHHIDNLRFIPEGEGLKVLSYWTVTKWFADDNRKVFEVTGHSLDRFIRTPDGLRFTERRVHYWRAADCPWVPEGTAVQP